MSGQTAQVVAFRIQSQAMTPALLRQITELNGVVSMIDSDIKLVKLPAGFKFDPLGTETEIGGKTFYATAIRDSANHVRVIRLWEGTMLEFRTLKRANIDVIPFAALIVFPPPPAE